MPDSARGSRRYAREMSLQALFFLDMHGDLENAHGLKDFHNLYAMDLEPLQQPFFIKLVQGVIQDIITIDNWISTHSRNWKLSRMSFVDRNILRLAVFELIHCPDIPMAVSINEAVDLGKTYGTRESGAFINGILDGIRISLEKEGLRKDRQPEGYGGRL